MQAGGSLSGAPSYTGYGNITISVLSTYNRSDVGFQRYLDICAFGGSSGAGSTIRLLNQRSGGTALVESAQIDSSGNLLLRQSSNAANTSVSFNTTVQNALTLDASGRLIVGNTSQLYGFSARLYAESSSSATQPFAAISSYSGDVSAVAASFYKYDNNSTTSQLFVRFAINNGTVGSGQINANGASAAAFGSFSDSRLKENIIALPNQLSNICNLKPCEFDYKNGSGHQIGFIAQEMQEVYPDVVGEGEDGMLTITGWSKTEARLVKAIQELHAEIELLKAKVN